MKVNLCESKLGINPCSSLQRLVSLPLSLLIRQIHHLFFTKVPHYRLHAATQALQKGMKERGQDHLYKQIDTPDYTQEIIKQYYNNWFYVDEKNVVRE